MKAVKVGLGVSLIVNFVMGSAWLNSQKERVRETVLTTPTIRQEAPVQKKNLYELASANFKEGSFKTIQIQFSSALGEFGESVVRVAGKKHGELRWVGTHNAELDLDQTLRTEESVSLSLDPELCPEGWELGKNQNLTIQTEGFKLLSIEQDELYSKYSIITLKFNSNCVREELAKHLVFYEKNRYLDWSIKSIDKTEAKLEVKRNSEDKFYVKVKEGVKNAYGSALKKEKIKNFSFIEELRLSHAESQRTYQNELYFKIRSNLTVDLLKAKDFMDIQPEVDFHVEDSWRGFQIRGKFKPEQTYTLIFKKGFLSKSGQSLEDEKRFVLKTHPYRRKVTALTEALYLPDDYEGLLPCRVTAMDKVKVKTSRIYSNNILPFLQNYRNNLNRYGKDYSNKVWQTESSNDKSEVLNLAVGEILEESPRGLYYLEFKENRQYTYGHFDDVLVIRTDLALSVTDTGQETEVLVSSLHKNLPKSAVKCRFYSYQNQLLAEATTDENGLAKVRCSEDVYLITAKTEDDFSFIKNSDHRLDQSQFKLGARWHTQEAYEGALYATRALVRPGEEISFSGTLRKLDGSLPELDLPIELILKDPRDKVILKKLVKANKQGVIHEKYRLDKSASLGRYSVTLRQPGKKESQWARTHFRVAAYQPDRFKTNLKPDLSKLQEKKEFQLKASAQYYFGRPVASAPVTLKLNYSETDFKSQKYSDYSFVDKEEGSLLKALKSFTDRQKTDLSKVGKKTFDLKVPEKAKARSAISVNAELDTLSASGRTVTAKARFTYYPYQYYFGLKDNGAEESKRKVSFVKINHLDESIAQKELLKVQLFREDWEYVYRENHDGLYWDWQKDLQEVKTYELSSDDLADASFTVDCPTSGVYILRLSDGQQSTALRFYHQYGDDDLRLKAPEYLKLNLDAKNYKALDEAELSFHASEDGFIYLRLLQDKLLYSRSIAVKKGENKVTFIVPEVKHENIHVAVSLQHNRVEGGRKLPRRLFGLTQLKLQHSEKKLSVKIINDEQLRSGEKAMLRAEILDHQDKGAKASVHLFAVDRGLLALAPYQLIDQKDFFYGARYWSNSYSDVFDSVYPDEILTYRKGTLFGGGGMPMLSKSAAPVEAVLARKQLTLQDMTMEKASFVDFGLFESNDLGYVKTEVEIPEFNGELVFFAVAVAEDAFGEAKSSAVVQDPVTVQTQSASVMVPHDESILKVVLFNNEESAKTVELNWQLDKKLKALTVLPQSIRLEGKAEKIFNIPVQALDEAGSCQSSVGIKSRDYEKNFKIFTYIRSAVARESRTKSLVLKSGEKQKLYLAKDWQEGTAISNVAIASNPFVNLNNYASFLHEYPYGCLEQTVSRAFPKLYLDTLQIKDPKVASDNGALIEQTIKKILSLFRTSDGAFAMWQGNRQTWHSASIYAAHFLTEAMNHTYEVPESEVKVIVRYLKSVAKGKYSLNDFDRAYALYVLASLGHGQNVLAEEILKSDKASKRARFVAASALVRTGRSNLVQEHLAKIRQSEVKVKGFDELRFEGEDLIWEVICELEMEGDKELTAYQLQSLIDDLDRSGFYVTFKSSILLFACGRWAELNDLQNDVSFKIAMNNDEEEEHSQALTFRMENSSDDFVMIENTSQADLHFTWQGSGAPIKYSKEAQGKFVQIERSYLDSEGRIKKDFKVGDLLTVSLKLKTSRYIENAVIVDLLPGAFRIEDDSLETRAKQQKNIKGMMVNHSEELDDRLLIFANLAKSDQINYTYQVRVVAEGEFQIPAASVESMYRPDISARSAVKGTVKVSK